MTATTPARTNARRDLATGRHQQLGSLLGRVWSVDAVGVEERAASLAKRSIKKDAKLWALDLAIRMMDLTTLEGKDTPGKVRALAGKARRPDPTDPSIPSVAALCVYPNMIPTAVEALKGSGVKVASVATYFPSGQAPLEVKLADVRSAVELGADEIDMVIDRGAFLAGDFASVYDEIVAVKDACGDKHLKVILETGELETYDNVRRASVLAMAAGADFIKTSTGKVQPAATLPVTLVMLEAIRDFHAQTGRVVGMKPAGGIKTAKEAISYLTTLYETLGPRLDDARPLPLRRVQPAQRRPDADPQGAHRPILRRRLLHPRLSPMQVAPGTIAVWSDLGCPWSHAVVWRLHDAGARLGLEGRVAFDHHVFPLELFNSEPTPRPLREAEGLVASALAPRAGWQAWSAPDARLAGDDAAADGGRAGREAPVAGGIRGARPWPAARLLGREPMHQPAPRHPRGGHGVRVRGRRRR